MSEYIILQTIPRQTTVLFLNITDETCDTIEPDDDTIVIFAVENGNVVRQLWDGMITPDKVFSPVGTRLLGIMTSGFHGCSVYEAKRYPDGRILSGGKVIDPKSI